MQTLSVLFLQAGPNLLLQYGPIVLIFIVFYFFILRPQSQKQNKQDAFIKGMEKGDEVVTSSGILGKITKMEDNIITLEVGSKSYIRVTKGAISRELTEEVFKKAGA